MASKRAAVVNQPTVLKLKPVNFSKLRWESPHEMMVKGKKYIYVSAPLPAGTNAAPYWSLYRISHKKMKADGLIFHKSQDIWEVVFKHEVRDDSYKSIKGVANWWLEMKVACKKYSE